MSLWSSRAFVLSIWVLFLPTPAKGTSPLVQVELASKPGTRSESPARTQADAEQALARSDAGFWFPELGIVRTFRLVDRSDLSGPDDVSLAAFVLSNSADLAGSRFLAKLPAKDLLRSVDRPTPTMAAASPAVLRSVAFSDGFESGRLDKWQVLTHFPGAPNEPDVPVQ